MDIITANQLKEFNPLINADTDFLFDILGPENNVILADEIMISDGSGIVLRISETYEKNFGLDRNSIIGKSVFDLEGEGIFSPSITAMVIKQRKKVILSQRVGFKHTVFTTGIPIFNQDNHLKFVVCFNTITMEQLDIMQKKHAQLQKSVRQLTEEIYELRKKNTYIPNFIFKSRCMVNLWDTLCYTASTKANVIITGETGVGKSAIAKAIHKISDRANGPFIEINCGAIHENLIESELFGYEKGAFTGASNTGKTGKVELANHGTLFLDEIGELPLSTQVKLLQLIQEKTIERVSGTKKIEVNFKLIVATNRDLEKDVEAGIFRKDLYYRLNVLRVHIPPLRERKEDICPLALSFLSKFNAEYSKDKIFSPRLLDFFEFNTWPGNVRQLENLVERLVITCQSPIIDTTDLPYDFTKVDSETAPEQENRNLFEMVECYERQLVLNSYYLNKTSIALAKDLGISQATAARKIDKYVKRQVNS